MTSFTSFFPVLRSMSCLVLLVVGSVHAQQLTVTLTGSMHNGSSIPCFGKKVGTISSSVSGGAAPYTYKWSNGETTSNITGIAAGFYSVDVKDANGTVEKAVITLTEPEPLSVFADPFVYPNGKNISCFECFNGSIDLQVEKGTPPYSYLWQDGGVTTQDRTGLGAKSYEVTVTDANGCEEKAAIALEQPESNDWKMGGNAGTNPATQYIGTSDNKDVVFKANGQESLRLLPNGDIKLTGSMAQGGVLFRREDGRIAPGDLQDWSETLNPADPGCVLLRGYPYWRSDGNTFENVCPEVDIKLGTLTPQPLRIVTNDQTRVFVSTDGNVGIGVATPLAKLHVQGDLLFHTPHGSIISTNDNDDGIALWTRNNNAAWGLSIDPSGTGHILGDMNDPQPAMSFNYDRVTVTSRLVVGEPEFGSFGLYKVLVDGGVACRDVLVKTGTFPDYVFQPNYALMPLGDLRTYLLENSHLPGIPSAAEVEEKGGVEVGDLQVRMLRALEEQALYILQLEERLQAAEQRLSTLNSGK